MVRSLNNVERWQQLDETTNQTERLSTLGRVYNRYDRQIKTTLMSSSSIQDILYIYTLFFSQQTRHIHIEWFESWMAHVVFNSTWRWL